MELKELEVQFTALGGELKSYFAKAADETKRAGEVHADTTAAIEAIKSKLDAVQKQADGIDLKMNTAKFHGGGGEAVKSLGEMVTDSESYKAAKAIGFRIKDAIRAPIDSPFSGRKSTITLSSGLTAGSTGIVMPQRIPGILGLAQQELRVRDLMKVTQMTTGNSFDYVRQTTRTNAASPQVEGSAKAESTYAWDSVSGTVKTIAHFTNVSRQAIEDVPWLQDMINSELMYGLLLKEESEILAGDGTGQHLNGLITQATAYNTALNVASDTKLDILRHAKLQARLAGLATFAPDGIVLNPTDMEKIELIKAEEGGANKGLYVIGDPKSGTQTKFVWGLPVVESDSITAGTFLIGAFGTAAELIDRMAAMVEISFEHASNFTANLASILAELRVGLAVRRPSAFITGSL